MSEMIERVARALAIADGMHPEAVSNGEDAVPVWTLYVDDARAAIEAMREPTDVMVDAGYAVTVDDETEVWQAMIDAALSQKGE